MRPFHFTDDTLEAIERAERIDRVTIELDHRRGRLVWRLQADGNEIAVIEGGPDQLPGMLLCAEGLIAPEFDRQPVLTINQGDSPAR